MPKDFLFPSVAGVSRVVNLVADRAFGADLLGSMVNLSGYTLVIESPDGNGFFIVCGPGVLDGQADVTLGEDQATMVAVSDGHFKFIDNPLETIQQLVTHAASAANPHNVTKAQVGLGSVNNTADAEKPVSNAQAAAIAAALASAIARANHTGTQQMDTIVGLIDALSNRAPGLTGISFNNGDDYGHGARRPNGDLVPHRNLPYSGNSGGRPAYGWSSSTLGDDLYIEWQGSYWGITINDYGWRSTADVFTPDLVTELYPGPWHAVSNPHGWKPFDGTTGYPLVNRGSMWSESSIAVLDLNWSLRCAAQLFQFTPASADALRLALLGVKSYANEAAALADGLVIGCVFFNTTTSRLENVTGGAA